MEMIRLIENDRLYKDRKMLSKWSAKMYEFQNRAKRESPKDSSNMYDELFEKFLDEHSELSYSETLIVDRVFKFIKSSKQYEE